MAGNKWNNQQNVQVEQTIYLAHALHCHVLMIIATTRGYYDTNFIRWVW